MGWMIAVRPCVPVELATQGALRRGQSSRQAVDEVQVVAHRTTCSLLPFQCGEYMLGCLGFT